MASASYPAPRNLYAPPTTRKLVSHDGKAGIVAQAMMRLIQLIFSPIISVATLPYHVMCMWLSLICNVTLKMLVRLGKPPKWYILAIHSRDLAMALENMQLREDGYRHQMDELKQEVERHDKDRRLAIRKVRTVHCTPSFDCTAAGQKAHDGGCRAAGDTQPHQPLAHPAAQSCASRPPDAAGAVVLAGHWPRPVALLPQPASGRGEKGTH